MTTTRRALYLRGTTFPTSYWRGSQSSQDIPTLAILTESGAPILTEFGAYLETES